MKTFRTLAITILLAAAPAAGAGESLDADLVRAGIDPTDAAAVIRTTEQLKAHGITPDPVMNKVREGIAKKASPQAIADAAAKLGDRMSASAPFYPGLADPVQKTAAVEAAAKVMLAGGRVESVKNMFEKMPSSALGRHEWHRPFDAYAALIIGGAGEARSASIVSMALDRGYSSTEITALPIRFGRLVSSGQTPQQAAEALLNSVSKDEEYGQGQGRGSGGPAMHHNKGDDFRGPETDNSMFRGSGKAKSKKSPTTTGGGARGSGAGDGSGEGAGSGKRGQ